MKICVCNLTVGDEYYEKIKLGINSIKEYCKINNYDFILEKNIIDSERHVYWNKILLIQKCLLKGYDFVVWFDSDIMVMKMERKLEDIIAEFMTDDHQFLLANDPECINTGVWFCRNSIYTFNILSKIYEQRQFDGTKLPEQYAFESLLKNDEKLRNATKILPYSDSYLINASMYVLRRGSFLVHFMGIHKKEWMEQVMNDHYPFRKDGEPEWFYYGRIDFQNRKYDLDMSYMRIGVLCFITGDEYKESCKYGTLTKVEYCKKNRYTFIQDESVYDKTRHPAWSKILLAKKYLRDFDFIWIVDGDTMIFNDNVKLEKIILEHMYEKEFLACRDVSGKINSGSIFIKNTDYTYSLLDKIYSCTQFLDKYWEQDAINYIYNTDEKFREKASILEMEKQTIFNCPVGLYKPDIFMIHFYGPSDLKWIEKAMNDLYPHKREDENEYMYIARRRWHDERWSK
jgi:hypothetical protein